MTVDELIIQFVFNLLFHVCVPCVPFLALNPNIYLRTYCHEQI